MFEAFDAFFEAGEGVAQVGELLVEGAGFVAGDEQAGFFGEVFAQVAREGFEGAQAGLVNGAGAAHEAVGGDVADEAGQVFFGIPA